MHARLLKRVFNFLSHRFAQFFYSSAQCFGIFGARGFLNEGSNVYNQVGLHVFDPGKDSYRGNLAFEGENTNFGGTCGADSFWTLPGDKHASVELRRDTAKGRGAFGSSVACTAGARASWEYRNISVWIPDLVEGGFAFSTRAQVRAAQESAVEALQTATAAQADATRALQEAMQALLAANAAQAAALQTLEAVNATRVMAADAQLTASDAMLLASAALAATGGTIGGQLDFAAFPVGQFKLPVLAAGGGSTPSCNAANIGSMYLDPEFDAPKAVKVCRCTYFVAARLQYGWASIN